MNLLRHVGTCGLLFAALTVVGCSKGGNKEDVSSGASPMVADTSLVEGVNGKNSALVTFNKDQILGRTFLYGSDLQYSAYGDPGYGLYFQSLAIGHLPAQFKVAGNKLQLVVDQSVYFESDINHPARLIYEFPIVAQEGNLIQVSLQRSSPLLATMVSDQVERTSWIRSIQFAPQGNYLMIESTIEDQLGVQFEFMESVFPRDTIVPAEYKPLLNDTEKEDLAERYRFLGAGKVWANVDGERVQTEAASRFNIVPGVTIDWYVTPNIPNEYLPAIQAGVEGWNRYSQAMWGTDMVSFKGILPADVKMGDPRYNIINWDSVAVAGAAYESQATDPLTGIQSHSLIYLPNAWVNIGKTYWEKGGLSDAHTKAMESMEVKHHGRKDLLGRKIRTTCLHDAAMAISLNAKQDPQTFAIELLKGVLFHEVGHALGLAHNFKGSLSWDSTKENSPFTTSIMDYNQYHIERDAYDSPTAINGPLLEYDRQIIAALYNEAKGLDASPKVAVCNDEETDSQVDGIDPLCIRYDSGADPTEQLVRVKSLVTDAETVVGGQQSLAKAIAAVKTELGDAAIVKDEKAFEAKMDALEKTVKGLAEYYLVSGAQSLRYMTVANLRSLKLFKKEILPEGFKEADMRTKTWNVLDYALKLETLPQPAQAAITQLVADVKAWAKNTAYAATLAQVDREATLIEKMKSFAEVQTKIETAETTGAITKMRMSVIAGLIPGTAPYNYDKNGADYEAMIPAVLGDIFMTKTNGQKRAHNERVYLLTVIASFKKAKGIADIKTNIRTVLEAELLDANDTRTRNEVRALLALI